MKMVNGKRKIVLIAHNVRSALNVGSILRTAEGLGVDGVYLTGYTPYPEAPEDNRLPHLRQKQALQIHKTALGAEYFIEWHHQEDIDECIKQLGRQQYEIVALEQTPKAKKLNEFDSTKNIALIVGNEVTGLEKNVLKLARYHVQIPMQGRKESLNVAAACAIALYHLRYVAYNQS